MHSHSVVFFLSKTKFKTVDFTAFSVASVSVHEYIIKNVPRLAGFTDGGGESD